MLCKPWRCRGSYAEIVLNKIDEKIKRLLYIDDELHNNQLSPMNGSIPRPNSIIYEGIGSFYMYKLVLVWCVLNHIVVAKVWA